jgi:hypothetical protein
VSIGFAAQTSRFGSSLAGDICAYVVGEFVKFVRDLSTVFDGDAVCSFPGSQDGEHGEGAQN